MARVRTPRNPAGFSVGVVAHIAAVSIQTLSLWDKTGVLSPTVAGARGTGSRRLYSFADLVAARVAGVLRNADIAPQAMVPAVRWLQMHANAWADASGTPYLVCDGRTVVPTAAAELGAAVRQAEPAGVLVVHVPTVAAAVAAALARRDGPAPGGQPDPANA